MSEGDQLTFTIRRSGKDERPHSVAIGYRGSGLLDSATESVDFNGNSGSQTVTVQTAEGSPGDGDHVLRIMLKPDARARLGDPGSADIIIRDRPVVEEPTPPPAAERTTYTVDPPQAVSRGSALLFTVVRHGPGTDSPPTYRLVQHGWAIAEDWQTLAFDSNGRSDLQLPANYDPCGEPPTLLVRSQGNATVMAAANFSGDLPDRCKPGLLQQLRDKAPWWPIPVAIVVLGTLAYLARRYIPWPKPTLYATSSIAADPDAVAFKGSSLPNWPNFSTEVHIEREDPIPPDPLPITEADDG